MAIRTGQARDAAKVLLLWNWGHVSGAGESRSGNTGKVGRLTCARLANGPGITGYHSVWPDPGRAERDSRRANFRSNAARV